MNVTTSDLVVSFSKLPSAESIEKLTGLALQLGYDLTISNGLSYKDEDADLHYTRLHRAAQHALVDEVVALTALLQWASGKSTSEVQEHIAERLGHLGL